MSMYDSYVAETHFSFLFGVEGLKNRAFYNQNSQDQVMWVPGV